MKDWNNCCLLQDEPLRGRSIFNKIVIYMSAWRMRFCDQLSRSQSQSLTLHCRSARCCGSLRLAGAGWRWRARKPRGIRSVTRCKHSDVPRKLYEVPVKQPALRQGQPVTKLQRAHDLIFASGQPQPWDIT